MERCREHEQRVAVVMLAMIYSIVQVRCLFPEDYLTPYSGTRLNSRRIPRETAECQHVRWENRTFEEFTVPPLLPTASPAQYELHRFADAVSDGESSLRRRYLVGSIAYLQQPYYTFSVLEPGLPGGCKVRYWSATRSTVSETASKRKGGCRLAMNAGYFNVHSGRCLGNIVSDGRVVQTGSDEQNANFGIRQDGTITVGYIPDQEIMNTTNSFRQLVSGVVWLVRNGSSFVNESMALECTSHEDTGKMKTFVDIISARAAIGHDANGRLVIAQVNGQTHQRGANLHEFADLLIRHGVVNAINLDGGGSSTFVNDQILVNYPSDHCPGSPEYRCERPVSTIICIHDVQCIEPECSSHGSCDLGKCSCDPPWVGESCAELNCSLVDCSNHGECLDGVCSCDAGWMGDFCQQKCPSNLYGPNCKLTCYCYGRSLCDSITGSCSCPDGYHGYGCWQECESGYFGKDCRFTCNCSEHGSCSHINGSCSCDAGWTGLTCNDSMIDSSLNGMRRNDDEEESNSTDPLSHDFINTLVEPHPTVTDRTVGQEPSKDNELPSDETTPTQPLNNRTTMVAVAIVMATGIVSVLVHVLIWWVCHRKQLSYQFDHHKRTNRPRLKRRKLRKRPPFMQVPVQSSSDCSI